MRALGLSGVGLGFANVVGSTFHDMDEFSSVSTVKPNEKRPWWVKEREYLDTTCEIDWNMMARWDGNWNNWSAHLSQEEMNKRGKLYTERELKQEPGYTQMDYAMSRASWTAMNAIQKYGTDTIDDAIYDQWKNPESMGFPFAYLPDGTCLNSPIFFSQGIMPPERLGIPRWTGTPEQNAGVYRTAARISGGAQTHFLPLDDKTMKLLTLNNGTTPVIFEDVNLPYTTKDKCVIPSKCKYVAVTMITQNMPMAKNNAPDFAANQASYKAYSQQGKTKFMLRCFMRGLGYTIVFPPQLNVSWAVVSGIAEQSRMKSGMSPENGTLYRLCVVGVTDMPFPTSMPIDAGMTKFCYDCGKCADMCPSQAIVSRSAHREPIWEITSKDATAGNPTHLKPELFNRVGRRAWPLNQFACMNFWVEQGSDGCGICQGACVFNNFHESSIHALVKTTVATTPLLNSFFYQADKLFGYGSLPTEARDEFWFNPDKYLPTNKYLGTNY